MKNSNKTQTETSLKPKRQKKLSFEEIQALIIKETKENIRDKFCQYINFKLFWLSKTGWTCKDIEIKNITIEALIKDDDLLAVTPQFDDISNLETVNILLNILIADARQSTDIEEFIKTVISIWGTYDEAEGKS